MRHRRIEPDELRYMLNVRKMTYAQIGAKVGMSVSGVKSAARRARLNTPNQLSHKWALPWEVADEHQQSKVAQYLRILSSVAQGKKLHEDIVNTALRWARRLIAADLDVDYSREGPPNDESIVGGFFTKKADKESWHLKLVLDKAEAGKLRRL